MLLEVSDAGRPILMDGVRIVAQEEEAAQEGAEEAPEEAVYEENEGGEQQMGPHPGGPRDMSLLRSYLTHIAPIIWAATSDSLRMTREPVDSRYDLLWKVLKPFSRKPRFLDIRRWK